MLLHGFFRELTMLVVAVPLAARRTRTTAVELATFLSRKSRLLAASAAACLRAASLARPIGPNSQFSRLGVVSGPFMGLIDFVTVARSFGRNIIIT